MLRLSSIKARPSRTGDHGRDNLKAMAMRAPADLHATILPARLAAPNRSKAP
jgi:hypothetical protein